MRAAAEAPTAKRLLDYPWLEDSQGLELPLTRDARKQTLTDVHPCRATGLDIPSEVN